jgi:hypothetical protein
MSIVIVSTVAAIVLLLGVLIYTPWRLAHGLGLKRLKPFVYLSSLLLFIGAASMNLVSVYSSVYIDVLYLITSALLGFAFYLFLLFVCYEVIGRAFSIPLKAATPYLLLGASLISVYGIWNAYQFKTRVVEIPTDNLQQPVDIAVLADIQMGGHRGKQYLAEVVSAINAQAPDLVVIPGDLADSNAILTKDNFSPLGDLQAPAYFIEGNHDTYIDKFKLLRIIRQFDVSILENEAVETNGIKLVGLRYMNADENTFDLHPSTEKATIKSVIQTLDLETELPVVLLHHSPVGAEYIEAAGADLFIAGHTHAGGQVFPATVVANGFFYQYSSGLYRRGGLDIFVSPGIGTFFVPMRIGTENELSILRLTPRD